MGFLGVAKAPIGRGIYACVWATTLRITKQTSRSKRKRIAGKAADELWAYLQKEDHAPELGNWASIPWRPAPDDRMDELGEIVCSYFWSHNPVEDNFDLLMPEHIEVAKEMLSGVTGNGQAKKPTESE